MAKANISIQMELSTKDSGKKTNSMGMARKHGLTVHATRVSTRKEERTVMGSLYGQMVLPMKGTSLITTSMVLEHTHGQTRGSTKGNG